MLWGILVHRVKIQRTQGSTHGLGDPLHITLNQPPFHRQTERKMNLVIHTRVLPKR